MPLSFEIPSLFTSDLGASRAIALFGTECFVREIAGQRQAGSEGCL
jgi:hypothetical protein